MGLLDDLKQQADSVLSQQKSSEESRTRSLQECHKRMKHALQYWLDFCKALNVVKPDVRRSFHIEGNNAFQNLLQSDYNVNSRRITVQHIDYVDSIEVRFRCVSDAKITLDKDSLALVQRLKEHLWEHGLKFDLREIRREGAFLERGVFTINADVPVRFSIAANVDESRITLTVRNLERLGQVTYVYDVAEFGEELLEEMGKAILGQPNKLRSLGKHQAESAWSGPRRRATDRPDPPA